jgi:hypothetical protein
MRRPQIVELLIVKLKTGKLIALLGAAAFAPTATAQMHVPAISMPGAVAPSGFSRSAVSFTGRPHPQFFRPKALFLGDPFYADYPPQSGTAPAQPPPQVVIVQPASTTDAPPETRSEPLLIELQGNRYVRFGGRQQSPERAMNVPPDFAGAEAPTSPPITPRPSQPELPPAILVFRDGHREEAPEYAIVGGALYASGDYWQSGHWTETIQLSALNIPATIRVNHDAGIKFMLPSSPNEVVTRP